MRIENRDETDIYMPVFITEFTTDMDGNDLCVSYEKINTVINPYNEMLLLY